MSQVNPNDLTLINDKDDVLPTYAGAGENSMAGLEIELAFFNADSLELMSPAQNKDLRNISNAALGGGVHNEPTSETLEIASSAAPLSGLQSVMDDTNNRVSVLCEKAAGLGLKRSYFQEIPEHTAEELLDNLVDAPRYQAFFGRPHAYMYKYSSYFAVCKANQVSISYKDLDHMLENVRRIYFLAPFLFLMTDNSAGFIQGKSFTGHASMQYRQSLAGRGIITPYLFTAKTGEDYIHAHIDHVMNSPLPVYYDREGTLHRRDNADSFSFNTLKEEGLNIASNYWLAESILWPDMKIAALRNGAGEVVNHRYEARMFGVGIHQHQTALLIVAGLSSMPGFAEKADALLAEFGFSTDEPGASKKHLEKAYKDAMFHDNKFFHIPYGTGVMKDFAKRFADLLEDAYTGSAYEDALIPALSICRTGCTDGKVNRLLFSTMEDTLAFQKNYDPAIFADPTRCAHMIFEKDIRRAGRDLPCALGAL